jgi:receptor protein-tyrosine kinase
LALNDLLRVLWQRKLLIAFVTAAVILLAYGGTKVASPQYESTSTLALTPKNLNNDLFLLGSLDAIIPVYADAATSNTTLSEATTRVGKSLAPISVSTFRGTGILKIHARSTSPALARDSAQAVAQAMVDRNDRGEIGIPALKLNELDVAGLPTTPVFPRVKLTLVVAALLGFALGIGAALLRENLTTRIESTEDLTRFSGLPVFAEIPAEIAVVKMHSPHDLMSNSKLTVVAEALRDLRTNLLFSDEDVGSIVITSPDGSHGKTTVSFGLATTLASAGTRTLLVDGDLRRGRVAELVEIARSPGLMDVLRREASLEEAIRPTQLETLDILTGGNLVGDPGELLPVEFPNLLKALEQRYEVVVIDSTPAIPISDARVMARYADATILVARAGHARRRQVRQAIERLELISVKPTAAVLNYSRTVRGSSYYIRAREDGAERLSASRRSSSRRAARR